MNGKRANKTNSVLIVDDQKTNIQALVSILDSEYTVYTAENGQNAVKDAEKYIPDVILLDIVMPEMDGYTVIRHLKTSEKTKDIPVIFISVLNECQDEEKGLFLGAADYISKPFSPGIVKLRVNNQIKIRNRETSLIRERALREFQQLESRDVLPSDYGQDGNITGMTGSANDILNITGLERQLGKALTEVADVESAMTAMFDANPHPNIMFDDKFNLIDCNPAALEFLNFRTRNELYSKFHERMDEITQAASEDKQPVPTTLEQLELAAENEFNHFESKILLNGKIMELEIRLIKIPYKGSFAIVGYILDKTETNRQTRALAEANETNKLQLTKLRLAAKSAKIGMWEMEIIGNNVLNPDNHFLWSNEFRQLLGFKDETDFPDLLSSWSDLLHPEDKDSTLSAFERHILDTSGQTPYDIEFRCLLKTGEYRYFHDVGETVREENGNPVRIIGSMMDITYMKEAIFDIEKQRAEAIAANKSKSVFLSTMSHEIRTPINAILGISEILLMNQAIDESFRDSIERIYDSGDMLLGIINDLLDLSKIEAGKHNLIISNYQIASLLSDVSQINMMRIGSKPIIFDIDLDENIPRILAGDMLRLKQILNNLLSNAFKYTEIGKVKLKVFLGKKPADLQSDFIILTCVVSDTGPGMTKKQVAAIFDEYSRFNSEDGFAAEGTGLGMSITRNLVELMKGEIVIQSEEGKGTEVTVHIPQRIVNPSVLGKEMVENLRKFRTSEITQMKRAQLVREYMPYGSVLIVDDIETNLFVAQGLMAPYGLQIDIAHSGFEAIKKVKKGNIYDIVFMDHIMPEMDGIKTVQKIRNMGYTAPIVALTANAVAGQVEIFLANGFDDFVAKSIDVYKLNDVLNKFIRDKQPPEVLEAARQQAAIADKVAAKKVELENDLVKPSVTPYLAEFVVRDVSKSIETLKSIIEKGTYDKKEMRMYIVHVHGMKGVLINIGRFELSAIAFRLEMAGRARELGCIMSETGAFLDSLQDLVDELTPTEEAEEFEITEEERLFFREKLLEVKNAFLEYDELTADAIIAELKEKKWPAPEKDLLNNVAVHLLRGYFEEAADLVDNFVGR